MLTFFNIFFNLQPFIVFAIGIFLIVKKSKAIGITLFVVQGLYSFFYITLYTAHPNLDNLVSGNVFVGILVLIAGVIEIYKYRNKHKDDEKREMAPGFAIPIVIIILGIFIVAYVPIAKDVLQREDDSCPVTKAASGNRIEHLKTLIENGADPNEVYEGVSLVKRLLHEEPGRRTSQETYEIVQILLNGGYNVNETDEYGITPLMYAALDSRGYSDEDIENPYDPYDLPAKLTQLFIDYGAEVGACDNEGRTALMWACNYRGNIFSDYNDIESLPVISDVIVHTRSFPVFYHEQILKLVENGADVRAKDNNGFAALDYFRFSAEENSRNTYEGAGELYASQEYTQSCREIERLLNHE